MTVILVIELIAVTLTASLQEFLYFPPAVATKFINYPILLHPTEEDPEREQFVGASLSLINL